MRGGTARGTGAEICFMKDNSFMSGWFENDEELIYNVFVVMTIKDDFSDFKDRRGKSWRE